MKQYDFADAVNPFETSSNSAPEYDFSDANNPFESSPETGFASKAIDVGSDLGVSYAAGSNQLLKTLGSLYGLATGDMDNWAVRQGESGADYWNRRKSDDLKKMEQGRSEAIDAQPHQLGKFKEAIWKTVENPRLLASFVSEQAPMMVGPGAAGRGAGALASRAGAKAATAGGIGLGAAVGAGALLQGSDVGGSTYEEIKAFPNEVWEANPDFIALTQTVSPEQAKHELAMNYARKAAAASGAVSVATQAIPGGATIEKVLSKGRNAMPGGLLARAGKGFAGEATQEMLEEGSGQLISNYAKSGIDSNQSLTEGLGESAGLALLGGGVMGGMAGAASQPATPEQRQQQAREESAAQGGDALDQELAAASAALVDNQPQTMADFDVALPTSGNGVNIQNLDISALPPEGTIDYNPYQQDMQPIQPQGLLSGQPDNAIDYGPVEVPNSNGLSLVPQDVASAENAIPFDQGQVSRLDDLASGIEQQVQANQQAQELQSYEDMDYQGEPDLPEPSGALRTPDEMESRLNEISKEMEGLTKAQISKPINPGRDELLIAIAKAGGINIDEARAQGIDPQHNKDRIGKRNPFRKQGMTFDEMAETLSQFGYTGEQYSANELLERVSLSLAGDAQYAPAAMDHVGQLEALEFESDQLQRDLQEIEADLGVELTEDEQILLTRMHWEAINQTEGPLNEGQATNNGQGAAGALQPQADSAPRSEGGNNQEAGQQAYPAETEGLSPDESPLLSSYSEEDLQAKVEREQADTTETDNRAQVDREAEEFSLTSTEGATIAGSNDALQQSQAGDLFSAPPQSVSNSAKTETNAPVNETVETASTGAVVPVSAESDKSAPAVIIHSTSQDELTAALASIGRKAQLTTKGDDVYLGGEKLATVKGGARDINQIIAAAGKSLSEAIKSGGKPFPANPTEMTRDQFVVALEFGNVIDDFDVTADDLLNGVVTGSQRGTLQVDPDKLYAKILAQKNEEPESKPDQETKPAIPRSDAGDAEVISERIRKNAESMTSRYGDVPLSGAATDYVEKITETRRKLTESEEQEIADRHGIPASVIGQFEGNAGFGFGMIQDLAQRGDKNARAWLDESTAADSLREPLPEDYTGGHERKNSNLQGKRRDSFVSEPEPDAGWQQADLFLDPQGPKKQQLADIYATLVEAEEVSQLKSSVDTVTGPDDVAHLVSDIARHAQETFLAVVADNMGKVLRVIRHTKGLKDSASVDPLTVVAEIASIEGAAQVYYAHNHPSGSLQPSAADIKLTDSLNQMLAGTGVKYKGHVILGAGRKSIFVGLNEAMMEMTGAIASGERTKRVPVTERMLAKTGRMSGPVSSPADAAALVKSIESDDALILMNAQYAPVGVVFLSADEMKSLRDDRRVNRILKAIDTTNSSAAIIKSDDPDAAKNLSRFLNSYKGSIKLLDYLSSDGTYSDAEKGNPTTDSVGMWFMRRPATDEEPTGLPVKQVEFVVNQFLKKYKGADDISLTVHRTAETLPGYSAERDEGYVIEGRFIPESNELHLNASAFGHGNGKGSFRSQVEATIREEILVHKGLGFFEPETRQELYAAIQQAALESKELAELWDRTVRDYEVVADSAGLNEEERNRLYAEELLGTIAQEKPSLVKRGYNKIYLAIKNLLIRAGWVKPTTGMAELRATIYDMGDAFRKGHRSRLRSFSRDVKGELYSREEAESIGLAKKLLAEMEEYENSAKLSGMAENERGDRSPPMPTPERSAAEYENAIRDAGFDPEFPLTHESSVDDFDGALKLRAEIYNGGGLFDGIFSVYGLEGSAIGLGGFHHTYLPRKGKVAEEGASDIDDEQALEFLRREFPDATDEELDYLYEFSVADKNIWDYVDQEAAHNNSGPTHPLVRILDSDPAAASWELQNIRGKIAADQGFDAVAMDDENGTSYLIPYGSKALYVGRDLNEAEDPDVELLKSAYLKLASPNQSLRGVGAEDPQAFSRRRGKNNESRRADGKRTDGEERESYEDLFAQATSGANGAGLSARGNVTDLRNGKRVTVLKRSTGRLSRLDDAQLGRNTGTPTASLGHFFSFRDEGSRYGEHLSAFDIQFKKPLILSRDDFHGMAELSVDEIKAMRSALIAGGYDGIVIDELEWAVVLEGEKAYKAGDDMGDIGAFSRKMKQAPNPDREKALSKLGLNKQEASRLSQAIESIKNVNMSDVADRAYEGVFDGLAGIKRAEDEAGKGIAAGDYESSGYVGARLASGVSDTMTAVMYYGQPHWSNGVVEHKPGTRGLLDMFGELGENLTDWLGWVAGHRGEELMDQGRENNLDEEDIAYLKGLADTKEKRQLFQRIHKEYAEFNKSMLDLAEEAGLVKAEARKDWESEWYIPFYRDSEEDMLMGPRTQRGLSHQTSGIKQLRGGDMATGDLLENVLTNFLKLTDSSMKNMALLKTVDNLKESRFIEREPMAWAAAMVPKAEIYEAMLKDAKYAPARDAIKKAKGDVELAILTMQEQEEASTVDLLSEAVEEYINSQSSQGLEKMWSMVAPSDPEVIRVKRDGKNEFYRVHDESLLRGLTHISNTGNNGFMMRSGRWFKRLLTTGVTASPDFIIRNLVRDSVHSWAINKDGFFFGKDTVKGIKDALAQNDEYREMMFAGASFQGGYVHGTDPEAGAQMIRRALQRKGLNARQIDSYMDSILDSPFKVGRAMQEGWQVYRNFGDKMENSNRLATFQAARKQGKSLAQALYESKDLMDYSLRGNWAAMNTLTDLIPFLNARLQGLSKLARAAEFSGDLKDPRTWRMSADVAKAMTKIAMVSVLLAMANDDDERYKELQRWEQDAYWHIFLGDHHYRIPKPFEIGILAGTIPERMYRTWVSETQTNEELLWSLKHGTLETLSLNPVPQAVLPVIELWGNKSWYFETPIEGMGDANKLPKDRYNTHTSDLMVELGQLTGMSPKRMEHLWRGYTGTMGAYGLSVADLAVRKVMNKPAKGEIQIERLPVIKSFYKGGKDSVNFSTQYGSEFYDRMEEVRQLYGSFKELEGGERKAFLKENRDKLRFRKSINRTSRKISKLRKRMNEVRNSTTLSAKEKDTRSRMIQSRINQLQKRIVEQSKEAF